MGEFDDLVYKKRQAAKSWTQQADDVITALTGLAEISAKHKVNTLNNTQSRYSNLVDSSNNINTLTDFNNFTTNADKLIEFTGKRPTLAIENAQAVALKSKISSSWHNYKQGMNDISTLYGGFKAGEETYSMKDLVEGGDKAEQIISNLTWKQIRDLTNSTESILGKVMTPDGKSTYAYNLYNNEGQPASLQYNYGGVATSVDKQQGIREFGRFNQMLQATWRAKQTGEAINEEEMYEIIYGKYDDFKTIQGKYVTHYDDQIKGYNNEITNIDNMILKYKKKLAETDVNHLTGDKYAYTPDDAFNMSAINSSSAEDRAEAGVGDAEYQALLLADYNLSQAGKTTSFETLMELQKVKAMSSRTSLYKNYYTWSGLQYLDAIKAVDSSSTDYVLKNKQFNVDKLLTLANDEPGFIIPELAEVINSPLSLDEKKKKLLESYELIEKHYDLDASEFGLKDLKDAVPSLGVSINKSKENYKNIPDSDKKELIDFITQSANSDEAEQNAKDDALIKSQLADKGVNDEESINKVSTQVNLEKDKIPPEEVADEVSLSEEEFKSKIAEIRADTTLSPYEKDTEIHKLYTSKSARSGITIDFTPTQLRVPIFEKLGTGEDRSNLIERYRKLRRVKTDMKKFEYYSNNKEIIKKYFSKNPTDIFFMQALFDGIKAGDITSKLDWASQESVKKMSFAQFLEKAYSKKKK